MARQAKRRDSQQRDRRKARPERFKSTEFGETEIGLARLFGPAGEVRDAPIVRPDPDAAPQAPTLRKLQREGRATVPRTGALLDHAVKRGSQSRSISDALDLQRRD